ncbi:MAG TPA: hypothetical protein PJ994_00810 [Tepidiformaceae bacterium]|nr:hypothetical protein [Tepidiformaceae bacterium]HMO95235.1 hypothetical protein [Tepidiformaceae bacterium]
MTDLPSHVTIERRDGRKEVLLHRSMAVIGENKIEIKAARGTVLLPIAGLALAILIGWYIGARGFHLPLWVLVGGLFLCLVLVPFSVMSLISAIVGADVIVDAQKGSATWQQGYLGMGIGTKELVPFAKIHHLEITVEGDEADRWREQTDDLRQFALVLVKRSGKRLTLAQVPVPAYGQTDGMDRTLAVGQAVAELVGSRIELPEGWELTEINVETGEPVAPEPFESGDEASPKRRGRGRRR